MDDKALEEAFQKSEILYYIRTSVTHQWRKDRQDIEDELRLLERLENPLEEDEATKALRPIRDNLDRRRRTVDAKHEGAEKMLDEQDKYSNLFRKALEEAWSQGYADRVSEEEMGYGPYEK